MNDLLIRIKKKSDGSAALSCLRADGSVTWQRQNGQQARFFPLHDLTHYAVETVLGHTRGFYGLVAEGWDLTDFGSPWPRGPLPPEALVSEFIVGFLDRERGAGVVGPPSIAWLTWHLGFWWSMVLDHSFGDGALSRENVMWPGNADAVREWLGQLQRRWRAVLEQVTDDDLRSVQRTRWPFQDRPFGDVIAWVNVELTKNAAEIGYARFLYAVSAAA